VNAVAPFSSSNHENHMPVHGHGGTNPAAHCLQQREPTHPGDVLLGPSYPCMTRSHNYDLSLNYSHAQRAPESYQTQYPVSPAPTSFYFPSYHSLYGIESLQEKN